MLRSHLAISLVLLVPVATARAAVSFTEVIAGTNANDAWFKCMADLNGDGRDDLVLGASFGPHEWFESKPGDTWTKHTIDQGGGTESAGWCDDVDGDGDIDLIIGGTLYFNPGGAAVTGIWPKHVLEPGRAYHDTRMADFDGDGKTDVAARNEASSGVDIYYQDSTTSWVEVVSDPGFGRNGLETVDVDGDGKTDIVTARHWMKNPGSRQGSWEVHSFNSNWDPYAAITHADMNQDGRRDLVMTVSEIGAAPAVWFENPPDPTLSSQWTAHTISADDLDRCHSVWVTDVDGDGHQDVFTSEFGGQERVLVFYGNADGSEFTTQVVSTAGLHNGAIGDYDADGDIDYFGTVVFGSGPIRVYRNDSLVLDDWTYIQLDDSRSSQAFGLGWGDLDGDGDLDVVSGPYAYRNPGGDMSASWLRTTLPANADANFVVDADADGLAEILAQALPNIYWFEATDAAATAYTSTIVANGIPATAHGSSQGYALEEIAGGGHKEYALTSGEGIYYLQVPPDPAAGNWPAVSITSQSPEEGLDLGDIDGDGDKDVFAWVGSDSGSNILGWWQNPGTGAGDWAQYNVGTVQGSEGDRIAVGDFDNDGKLDVAATGTTNSSTGSFVYWFRNPGNPTVNTNWTRTTIAADLGAMNSMDAADIDRDGDVDVVTGEHRGPLAVTIWENEDGGDVWTPNQVSQGIENHLGTRLADLDGDGDLDILGIAFDDFSKLHLWRNNVFSGPGETQVAAPIIQPGGGTFVGSVVVSMSTPTPGASIFYTINGADPTQSSNPYTAPITLIANATVRARGFKSGIDASDVSIATFIITEDTTPPIVLSVTASGDPNVVRLLYSEPVEEISAEDIGNYGIDQNVGVSSATLQPDAMTVLLSTSTLFEDVSYTLTINDVRDRADSANTIDPNTQVTFEYVAIVVPDGLVGYWSFNDGVGDVAADSTANGNDGTVQGAAWTDGYTAGGLNFDGIDDYVDLGGLDVAGSGMSIALWFKADDYDPADVRLFSKSTGTAEQDHYWMLSIVGGPKLRFRLKTDGSTSTLIADSGTLELGVWTHVVATYDGSAMRLYKDGLPVGSLGKSGSVSTSAAVAAWIGRNPGGYGPWDGIIDEVRVYDRALNENEIAILFSGSAPLCVDQDHDNHAVCTADCVWPLPLCGDCDDTDPSHWDDCTSICGNCVLDAGELCDDGNTDPADGCPWNCQAPICGDGIADLLVSDLVQDGTFDQWVGNDLVQWSESLSGGELTMETSDPAPGCGSGATYMALTRTQSNAALGILQQLTGLIPGRPYELSGWTKVSAGSDAEDFPSIRLMNRRNGEYLADSGTWVPGPANAIRGGAALDGSWTPFSFGVTTPSSHLESDPYLLIVLHQYSGPVGATVYHDDIRLRGPLDGGEQCDDGNIVGGDGCSAQCLIEDDCTDVDGDSHCASNDCSDSDSTVWRAPGEIDTLRFVDAVTMEWEVPADPGGVASALSYDAMRSDSPAELDAGAVCVANEQPGTSATDVGEPAVGEAYFYLSRARNDCPDGIGPWGVDSAGNDRVAEVCP